MQPRAAIRLARALWIVWAIIVWNVVFDHVIVVAGRNYIYAAGRAAAGDHPVFVNIDDWMRPAVTRALWVASGSAGAIILTGLVAIRFAASHEPQSKSVEPVR
jgi:hypothetical protein